MPWVPSESGTGDQDKSNKESGRYVCDHPGCSNEAKHVLGCAKELAMCIAMCDEHAKPRSTPVRLYRWTIGTIE
jgi:hypothetical protein